MYNYVTLHTCTVYMYIVCVLYMYMYMYSVTLCNLCLCTCSLVQYKTRYLIQHWLLSPHVPLEDVEDMMN